MTAPRRDPGYEQRDVSPRLPLAAAVVVLCLLALVLGLVAGAFALRGDGGPRATGFFELSLGEPGTPHLQAHVQVAALDRAPRQPRSSRCLWRTSGESLANFLLA